MIVYMTVHTIFKFKILQKKPLDIIGLIYLKLADKKFHQLYSQKRLYRK